MKIGEGVTIKITCYGTHDAVVIEKPRANRVTARVVAGEFRAHDRHYTYRPQIKRWVEVGFDQYADNRIV